MDVRSFNFWFDFAWSFLFWSRISWCLVAVLVSDVEHVNDKQDCYKSNYVENIQKCWCISSKIQCSRMRTKTDRNRRQMENGNAGQDRRDEKTA
ncbi:unnamed protein product [Oikopleura dioica]|uniref:Secreted protein n=1 Tax=Oikopleura dioica TaxID=34765 RepID=E4YNC5_OIKDI|nr:unnamed protein product [Oikopleura dioica]